MSRNFSESDFFLDILKKGCYPVARKLNQTETGYGSWVRIPRKAVAVFRLRSAHHATGSSSGKARGAVF